MDRINLVEAVTGLLLAEPWLIGQQERGEHRALIPPDGASALLENVRGFSESAGMAEKGGMAENRSRH